LQKLHAMLALTGAAVMAARLVGSASPAQRADLEKDAPIACPGSHSDKSEHFYTVSGRARPLLIWTGRRDVGHAQILRREGPADHHFALVIGTDPDRAPMHINRWGYIAESSCHTQTGVVGVMTESDEATIDEAKTKVSDPSAHNLFKAIRMTIADGEARSETVDLLRPEPFSYRDLDTVLRLLPASGTTGRLGIGQDVMTGFLAAVDDLLHQLSSQTGGSSQGKAADIRRTYVYAQHLYDVTATQGRGYVDDLPSHRASAPFISSFEVRNRASGEVTHFQIAYGTTGALAAVPLRVIYRPRWWLELQLDRQNN
jgi:hypothetical protein